MEVDVRQWLPPPVLHRQFERRLHCLVGRAPAAPWPFSCVFVSKASYASADGCQWVPEVLHGTVSPAGQLQLPNLSKKKKDQ